MPRLAADPQPPPPRARPARLRRALQHATAAPRARPPTTATSEATADTDRRGGPSPRPPRRPHPRVQPNRRLTRDTTIGTLQGQLAHAAQLVARDAHARIVCSARAKRRAIVLVHFFENNAPPGNASSGQRSWRFHCSVLLSATRVRTRRSR